MHLCYYDNEPESFNKMKEFIKNNEFQIKTYLKIKIILMSENIVIVCSIAKSINYDCLKLPYALVPLPNHY